MVKCYLHFIYYDYFLDFLLKFEYVGQNICLLIRELFNV